ncbi:MAG: stress responsive protein [Candidatus Liberibacter europaeus]|uniref:Stress responsive protein n=1 Tax=Candidatus Liberibacter europaeus TaxID=744859 RepID=A0A2T4VZ92_9HYPH|nr:stress responsive protein [Candidatus Liberibacter europaeus]PTL87078.1 MAG: stress responsive protein [Candidatus Liberibacter europaeus]
MIRHIVFFTVLPENYELVRSGLSVLVDIPHARLIEIGDNLCIDNWSKEVDLIVYGEFDDQESLDAFKRDPLYKSSILKVKDFRKLRFVADYDTNYSVRSPK